MNHSMPTTPTHPAMDDENPTVMIHFVQEYASIHSLPGTQGSTLTEQHCAVTATQVRERFKNRRREVEHQMQSEGRMFPSTAVKSGVSVTNMSPDPLTGNRTHRTEAEKYKIRLRNNRKSAEATKVYTKVYHRLLNKHLQDMEGELARHRENRRKIMMDASLIPSMANNMETILPQRKLLGTGAPSSHHHELATHSGASFGCILSAPVQMGITMESCRHTTQPTSLFSVHEDAHDHATPVSRHITNERNEGNASGAGGWMFPLPQVDIANHLN